MRIPVKKKKLIKKRSESRSLGGTLSGGRGDGGGKDGAKSAVLVRQRTKSVAKVIRMGFGA